jgi:hypothetical protein
VPSIFSTSAAGGGGFLDRQRLVRAGGRDEAQHGEIGVGVEEDVLDELVRAHAAQVREAGLLRRRAAFGIDEAERMRAFRQAPGPGAGRIHEVALYVEDEFVARQRVFRGGGFECRLGRHRVGRAALAAGEEGGVHRQQGRRCATQRHQEIASRCANATRVDRGGLECQGACVVVHRFQRHGDELAVAGAVELDRQAQAVGVVLSRSVHGRVSVQQCCDDRPADGPQSMVMRSHQALLLLPSVGNAP